MITIIDYGMGNLGSLVNMFKRLDIKATVKSEPSSIQHSDKILLPGVGAFDTAMKCINNVPGLLEVLNHKAKIDCIPILGVCLGMQLLTSSSEEGILSGLGWIPAKTKRLPKLDNLKVPHMGWNIAKQSNPSLLTKNIDATSRYYFVHSFAVQLDDPKYSIMRTKYGIIFDSAIGCDNIFGVQFHPEKSHKFGMKILKNFSDL